MLTGECVFEGKSRFRSLRRREVANLAVRRRGHHDMPTGQGWALWLAIDTCRLEP